MTTHFEDWTDEILASIKRTCVPSGDLPPDHVFALFIYTCKKTGLDPILKEIFLQKRSSWNDRAQKWEESWQTMVSRDGYLAAAHRTGELRGIETKIYPEDVTQPPTSATCRVWRNGWEHPVEVTVAFDEYVEIDRKTNKRRSMWKDAKDGGKPRTMIGKVAESQTLRRAFSYHGTYSEEELLSIESAGQATDSRATANPSIQDPAGLTTQQPAPAPSRSLPSPSVIVGDSQAEPARVLSFKDKVQAKAAALPKSEPLLEGTVVAGGEVMSKPEYDARVESAKKDIKAAITHRAGLPVHPLDDEGGAIPIAEQILAEIGRLHPKNGDAVARRAAICDTLHGAFGIDVRPQHLDVLSEILDELEPDRLTKGLAVLQALGKVNS